MTEYIAELDLSWLPPLVLTGFALVMFIGLISWVICLAVRAFINMIKGR